MLLFVAIKETKKTEFQLYDKTALIWWFETKYERRGQFFQHYCENQAKLFAKQHVTGRVFHVSEPRCSAAQAKVNLSPAIRGMDLVPSFSAHGRQERQRDSAGASSSAIYGAFYAASLLKELREQLTFSSYRYHCK